MRNLSSNIRSWSRMKSFFLFVPWTGYDWTVYTSPGWLGVMLCGGMRVRICWPVQVNSPLSKWTRGYGRTIALSGPVHKNKTVPGLNKQTIQRQNGESSEHKIQNKLVCDKWSAATREKKEVPCAHHHQSHSNFIRWIRMIKLLCSHFKITNQIAR